jgi:murein tripeptide amidase MpaA
VEDLNRIERDSTT